MVGVFFSLITYLLLLYHGSLFYYYRSLLIYQPFPTIYNNKSNKE